MLQTYTVLFAQANIAILNKKKGDNMSFDCFFLKKKKNQAYKISLPDPSMLGLLNFKRSMQAHPSSLYTPDFFKMAFFLFFVLYFIIKFFLNKCFIMIFK